MATGSTSGEDAGLAVITYARRQHYADHLAPVAALVGDIDGALVASYWDLALARRKHDRIVLMQHGAGQSYSDDNPAYPGGVDNDAVGLFLTPNEHSATRWRTRYPDAAVEVVGTPRLDDLPARVPGPGPVIAFGFHWNAYHHPESRSAFAWYQSIIPTIAQRYAVLGHGHPRASFLPPFYAKHGIEHVASFDDVCRRADVYVADNTSSLFEFASTGRPVVVLNAPWYRRDVSHGLRFWDAASVGPNVSDPAELPDAIEAALASDARARDDALAHVYAYRSGAARRAADAIEAWA